MSSEFEEMAKKAKENLNTEFWDFIIENFDDMPRNKVANVFLATLGGLSNRFDTRGETEITKDDLMTLIKSVVDYENDPKTERERLLKRAKAKESEAEKT